MEKTRKIGAAAIPVAVYLLAALFFILPLLRLFIMSLTLEDGTYG